jgi:hypothetical protein
VRKGGNNDINELIGGVAYRQYAFSTPLMNVVLVAWVCSWGHNDTKYVIEEDPRANLVTRIEDVFVCVCVCVGSSISFVETLVVTMLIATLHQGKKIIFLFPLRPRSA